MISTSSEQVPHLQSECDPAPHAPWIPSLVSRRYWALAGTVLVVLLLALIVLLQHELEQRVSRVGQMEEQLRMLPPGDVIKPTLLGFHSLGADVLWLQVLQVLGQRDVSTHDYTWAYQALDVITTLDPHYVYAYDAGGLILAEQAGQVEWSNQLLKKGLQANPDAWRLAFQLGFNYFFHLQDYQTAAEYMAIAANLPGRPAYVPELVARLYMEANNPELALNFLAVMRQSAADPSAIALLERRYNEVLVERDLLALEQAIQRYREAHDTYPSTLDRLVQEQVLPEIPVEPFGGHYVLDSVTGQVSSTTHPQRLRLHRPSEVQPFPHVRVIP